MCVCIFVKEMRRAFYSVVVCATGGHCGRLLVGFGLGKPLRKNAKELIGSPKEVCIKERRQGASKTRVKLCRESYRQPNVAMNI